MSDECKDHITIKNARNEAIRQFKIGHDNGVRETLQKTGEIICDSCLMSIEKAIVNP